MAWFAWTATDAAGKTRRGALQAEGPKQVRQTLREQKLMPISITLTRERAAGKGAQKGAKLSTPVLSMFTRQLSTLVNAALPLESALKAISKQTEDKKLAVMVGEIRDKVVEGHTAGLPRKRDRALVPRNVAEQPDGAALPESRAERRLRRSGGSTGAGGQRHDAVLHDGRRSGRP